MSLHLSRLRKQHLFVAIGILFNILFPLAGVSFAQLDAGIVGQVTDESGAVLPGVTVTATSLALQVPSVTDVTNERGEYRLTPLVSVRPTPS